MRNEKREFTLLECVIVVAILLFVAGIAAQKLVHSIKASEEITLHDAATQYLAVKNMYAEQSHAASAGAAGVFNTPGR
jgi:type II secretory pathway pseudopilin PulG